MVTWNEDHNHVSNEEGFKKRKAKTDLINAIVTSGLTMITMKIMLILMTDFLRKDFYKRKINAL